MLGRATFVVPLQNGIEAPDILAAALGAERVLGGLCSIMAWPRVRATSGTWG